MQHGLNAYWWATIFLELLLTTSIFMTSSCIDGGSANVGSLPDADTGYDTVVFGSTRVQIPHVFHAGLSKPTREGEYAAIDMMVTAPDLRPLTAPPRQLGWTNQLTILIEYPRQFRKPEDILRDQLQISGRTVEEFSEMQNGCRIYHKVLMSDIITCDVDGRQIDAICGIKDIFIKTPSCKVMENISIEAHIIYTYSRDFVDLIPDIDRRMNALFSSFISSPKAK